MQMQDLFDGLYFNHSQPKWQSRGVFVGHIHLDKETFSILSQKEQYATLYYLFFLMMTVYIYT
jgi:hypothetical protein